MINRKIMCINFDDITNEEEYTETYIVVGAEYTFLNINFEDLDYDLQDNALYKRFAKDLNEDIRNYNKDNDGTFDKEDIAAIKNIIKEIKSSKREDFYKKFDTIKIETSNLDDCIKKISENKELFVDKTIILPNFYTLKEKSYNEFIETAIKLQEVLPNNKFEVNVDGDTMLYSIDEYLSAYKIINDIVTLIKSLNLSPLEQIMFAYDFVKKRNYKVASENDNVYASRDVISSLLGDKIVCAGFNAIFETILNNLGHKPITVFYDTVDKTNDDGHVRTSLYIDDPKYNVKGIYFFDVTADANKKYIEDPENNYSLFLRTLDEMIAIDRKWGLIMIQNKFMYPNFLYQLFRELPDTYSYDEFIKFLSPVKYNEYLKALGLNPINISLKKENSKEKLLTAFQCIYGACNNPIDPVNLIELLYNVRKIEYYLNPEEYPFSVYDIKSAFKIDRFTCKPLDSSTKTYVNNVLKIDESEYCDREREKALNKVLTDERKKEIESVKLTRSLRSHLINNK